MALALTAPTPSPGWTQWLACGEPTYLLQAQMNGRHTVGALQCRGNSMETGSWCCHLLVTSFS